MKLLFTIWKYIFFEEITDDFVISKFLTTQHETKKKIYIYPMSHSLVDDATVGRFLIAMFLFLTDFLVDCSFGDFGGIVIL